MENKLLFLVMTSSLFLFLFNFSLLAEEERGREEEKDIFMHLLVGSEVENVGENLEVWTDSEMIAELSRLVLNEDYIKSLYQKFREVTSCFLSEEESLQKREDLATLLRRIEQLGKKIHNLNLAFSEQELSPYQDLLSMMRDVLYLNMVYLSSLLEEGSGKIYFYTPYEEWMDYLEREYRSLFGEEDR